MIRLTRLTLAFAVALAAPVAAATVSVTPATFAGAIAAAAGGDVLKLTAGTYPDVYIRGGDRTYSPPLIIDSCGVDAPIASLRFDNRAGLRLSCLSVGTGGLKLNRVNDVVIKQLLATGARSGISVGGSTNVVISDAEFVGSTSDGIDVADSQRVTIERVTCYGARPSPGAHPDCVQLYGRSAGAALADIVVRNSTAVGDTQGFNMFGNLVPARNVRFEGLHVMGRYSRGISMTSTGGCIDCAMVNSRVERMRGATHAVQIDPVPARDGTLPKGWALGSLVGNSVTSSKP